MRRVAEQASLFQTRMREAQSAARKANKVAQDGLASAAHELLHTKTERDALADQLNAALAEILTLRSSLETQREASAAANETLSAALTVAQADAARAEHQCVEVRARFVRFVQRSTSTLRSDVEQLAQSIDEIQGARVWRLKRVLGHMKK
jgi:hypothetical protein